MVDGLADRLVDELVGGLAENQKEVLRLIYNDAHISKRRMAEIIGISTTAVDKNLETLKKKGLVKRVGSAKKGHWEIVILPTATPR